MCADELGLLRGETLCLFSFELMRGGVWLGESHAFKFASYRLRGEVIGMELFDLAVRLCSRRRAMVVLVGCFVLILASWLSNEIDSVPNSVLYAVACFALIAAIASWLLGARSEQKAISELMAFSFPADGAVAEKWAALVTEARPHLYLFRHWRRERTYHKVCKLFYVGLWICLGAYCLFSLPSLNLPPAPTFLFAVLCAIVTGLCCASYYFLLCMHMVYR